jgi:hypothetical protein
MIDQYRNYETYSSSFQYNNYYLLDNKKKYCYINIYRYYIVNYYIIVLLFLLYYSYIVNIKILFRYFLHVSGIK